MTQSQEQQEQQEQKQQGLQDESLTSITEQASLNTLARTSPKHTHQAMQAVPLQERIAALDVIRGFALIGIFFMNIEFFNRSIHDLGDGMPQGLTGIDWLASYFVQYFIAGKFWTMFSLLFGMGFAVMLTRANEKGQEFLKPYIRRVIALAIFGACHFIFIWPGDILLSYASTAVMLLVILFGKAKWIVLATLICGAIAMIPNLGFMGSFAGIFLMAGVIILFIRYEKIVDLKFIKLPFLSMIYLFIGLGTLIFSSVAMLIPSMHEIAVPSAINGIVVLGFGMLMKKFHQPERNRTLAAGIGLYTSIFIMMTAFGAYQLISPKSKDDADQKKPLVSATANKVNNKVENKLDNKASATVSIPNSAQDNKEIASANVTNKTIIDTETKEKTPEEIKLADKEAKKVKQKEEREKEKKKEVERKKNDIQTLTKGSYAQAVQMRIKDFHRHLGGGIGMAINVIAMFLIGFWFVNIGIMKEPAQHLTLFKKMAIWGLPVGIGMGMLGGLVITGDVPNKEQDGFMFALGLQMLFNLPACMGYVGLIVWMLHSKWASVLNLLAPFGRMALTNYLSQSLIAATVFYGYGFGLWGMGRAHQLLFASFILVLQIIFSHVWLKFFRYGPLEWVWRAITYWKIPAMRNAT